MSVSPFIYRDAVVFYVKKMGNLQGKGRAIDIAITQCPHKMPTVIAKSTFVDVHPTRKNANNPSSRLTFVNHQLVRLIDLNLYPKFKSQ